MSARGEQRRRRGSPGEVADLGWAAVYVMVEAALALGTTQLQRYPVFLGLLVAALVVPSVALGFLGGRLLLCTLAAVPLVLLTIVASFQSDPAWFAALVIGGVAAAVGAVLIALGVGLSWLIARGRPPWRDTIRAVFAGLLLATAPVCLIVPLAERHRTIRLSRARPIAIEPAAGRYRGVGLGDHRARIETTLGRGAPEESSDSGPLDPPNEPFTGPNSVPSSARDQAERYRGVSFHLGRSGRVDYVEIINREARTPVGVGPGDSLSVAAKAYPTLQCGEDAGGADPPVPFPYCSGRLGPRRYVYLASTYQLSGVPITAIWLSTTAIS